MKKPMFKFKNVAEESADRKARRNAIRNIKNAIKGEKKIVETGIEKYGKLKAFRKTRFENKKLDVIKKKKFEERLKSQKANVNDKKNRLKIILRARQNMDIEEEEKDKLEKEMQVTKQTVLKKRKELYYELKEKERILYKRKRKGKRLYYEQKEKGKIQSTKQEVPKKVVLKQKVPEKVVLKQKVPEKVVLKQEVPKKGKELYYELKKDPEKNEKICS